MTPGRRRGITKTASVSEGDGAATWWRGATIYQVYPRSFLDTNGDGVGDLPGVVKGLDYIAHLGVDGLWLSPFFTSPMRDYGYDVADYCDVDPVFGTLADFDRLLAKAHALGLKVIIDQVYSHTSDHHAWFRESRADRFNEKADWYVWADAKPDGGPPNNWLSVFGGPAWTWDARRRQYYLHNFLASQPDLNLYNKAVQNALIAVAQFWLDRGVNGFRLDALNFGMHDRKLRNNPPADGAGAPYATPYEFQKSQRNLSYHFMTGFLERLRTAINAYDGVHTVAEIADADPLAAMQSFTQGDGRLNAAYNFDFLYAERLEPRTVVSALSAWSGGEGEGWPAWAFSNHDAPRVASRWTDNAPLEQCARLYLLLLAALRGNIFLYQGEELGLPQADLALEDLKDPEAIANWPATLGRDGARTPMPWRRGARAAGFTDGVPWLPVPEDHYGRSIDEQEKDPASVLCFARGVIGMRNRYASLRSGAVCFENTPDGLLAFLRTSGDEQCLCVFNLSDYDVSWTPPDWKQFRILAAVALGNGEDVVVDVRPSAPLPTYLSPASGYVALRR
ncbi:MAG: alpha-glucosidase [Pseudomonadota bacterium]